MRHSCAYMDSAYTLHRLSGFFLICILYELAKLAIPVQGGIIRAIENRAGRIRLGF